MFEKTCPTGRSPFYKHGMFFSLCCVKHNDPEHRELTRDLHGLRWREERKGLKRGVNGEDTQKRGEVPGRGNNVLSADLGLFMSDKHPVVRGSSNPCTGRKNKHKSIKDSGPACALYLITVSCVLSCLWPHSCFRDGRFLCFLPPPPSSCNDNQCNLSIIIKCGVLI